MFVTNRLKHSSNQLMARRMLAKPWQVTEAITFVT